MQRKSIWTGQFSWDGIAAIGLFAGAMIAYGIQHQQLNDAMINIRDLQVLTTEHSKHIAALEQEDADRRESSWTKPPKQVE